MIPLPGSGAPRLPYLLASVALCAGLWAGIAVYLQEARSKTLEEARIARTNLARVIAAYQDASIRAVDSALRHLRDEWRRSRAGFEVAVAQQEEYLKKEHVIQVAVVDQRGEILYSRLPGGGGNFADRAYFQAQRDAVADEIVVSEPVLGRITKQWAIQFSRRMTGADGAFQGLIVVAVPPPALERFFGEIDLGHAGVIAVARLDGTVLARNAGPDDFPRATLAGSPALSADAPLAGDFTAGSGPGGPERLFSYQKLEAHALVALVGQSPQAALEPYRRLRRTALVNGLGATLLLLSLGWLVAEFRRREIAARDERERVMLELHDGAIQDLYAVGLSLEASRRQLAADGTRARIGMAEAQAALSVVMQDLRSFISGRPGVAPVGAELARRMEAMVPAELPGVPRFSVCIDPAAAAALTPDQATHVLRIARESISNIVRHAEASEARVSLRLDGDGFCLEAIDDGRGIAAPESSPGLGLRHIQARAKKLGGRARVAKREGGGTAVSVEFPARR